MSEQRHRFSAVSPSAQYTLNPKPPKPYIQMVPGLRFRVQGLRNNYTKEPRGLLGDSIFGDPLRGAGRGTAYLLLPYFSWSLELCKLHHRP